MAGEKVLVSGIGGGVALFACQFAPAKGADVWVTSGGEGKISRAIQLGAKGGTLYTRPDWGKVLKSEAGLFDLIIDSAGGDGWSTLVDLAAPGGRIAIYGGTRGAVTLNPQKVFWKQLDILGTTMGSDEDFSKMIEFVEKHTIRPVVDSVFSLENGLQAFERMDAGKQFGKIVLEIS